MKLRGTEVVCYLLILLLLVACGQSETTTIEEGPSAVGTAADLAVAEATVTETSQPPTETAVPPTETAEPTATIAPTATVTFTPTPEAVVSSCLDCHGEKQTLIDTAAPPEEPESSESSGVG